MSPSFARLPARHACTRSFARGGLANPVFDGTTPRQAQRHLWHQFEMARAKWARLDIRPFGFRVCEPHNWHLLLVRGQQVATMDSRRTCCGRQVRPGEKPYLIARVGLNRAVLLQAAGSCVEFGSGGRITDPATFMCLPLAARVRRAQ